MSVAPEINLNKAGAIQIAAHLRACDNMFVPPLSGRVDIDSYAKKIADKSIRFEGWVEGELVGLVAVYCNDGAAPFAYITSVSVLPQWGGRGIASQLVECCIDHGARWFYVFRNRIAGGCATDDDRRRVGIDELHHASDVVTIRHVLLVGTISASAATVHPGAAPNGAQQHSARVDERRRVAFVQLDSDRDTAGVVCREFCNCAEDL